MENSSFGENTNFFALTDIIPLQTNGATSDTYKVRINGKWHFLKRPKKQFSTHPQCNLAFEKEFDIGYTLEHPNIVYINDWMNDIFSYWAAPQYRTEDNPYIKIKLGSQ